MTRFDVTIAGEVNLDLILYGVAEELPRERERLADRMRLTLGGSSPILAHNLAALGSRVIFFSRASATSAGDSLDAGFLHECLHGGAYRLVSRLAIWMALSPPHAGGGIEAFRDAAYRHKFFEEHSSGTVRS